jgi:hypothetical protein
MTVVFKNRFLDAFLLTDRRRLHDLVFSFTNLRKRNTLATYTLVSNPQSFLYEIIMNTEHYVTEERDDKKKKCGVLENELKWLLELLGKGRK